MSKTLIVDTATTAQPRSARHYVVTAESRRPVARDYRLIWLLTFLGGLGLLFWSAIVLALVTLL